MSQPLKIPVDHEPARSTRILAAAERAFARHGFHGASMQHVAQEAGMSAGNLYRYFQSKNAIVSGLAARDHADIAMGFSSLAHAPDFLSALGLLLRKHLVEEPIWRVRVMIEIWAEAGRNPAIATMCDGIDREIEQHLTAMVIAARARAGVTVGEAPAFVVKVMDTVVAGLMKRRATEPDFDGETEIAMALGIFRLALDGTLRPFRPDPDARTR